MNRFLPWIDSFLEQSTFLRLVCHFIVILKLLEMHQKPNRTNLSLFLQKSDMYNRNKFVWVELHYRQKSTKTILSSFEYLSHPILQKSFRGNHLRKYVTQRKVNTMRTNLPKPLDLLIFCIYSLNFSLEFFIMIFFVTNQLNVSKFLPTQIHKTLISY